ncbi:MAG TPA: hypothetical protein VJT85_03270 [Gemmatimonadaceae bacterium]|nr:hypothetical protein [Gemmatimonadaceae bacterium]
MQHRRLLVALVLAAGLASCRRAPVLQPAPSHRQASAAELAIYRVLTESTYVRSTGRPIAVVETSLDSVCTSAECPPLERRWGIESPWWAGVAGSEGGATAANAALLRHAADTVDLHAIADGRPDIIAIPTRQLPVAWSTEGMWGEFQYYNRGAAGVLRFSPIGFTPSGKEAIVFARWECGPMCGHTVVAALRSDSTSSWQIADMLLLSSRKPSVTVRAE